MQLWNLICGMEMCVARRRILDVQLQTEHAQASGIGMKHASLGYFASTRGPDKVVCNVMVAQWMPASESALQLLGSEARARWYAAHHYLLPAAQVRPQCVC